MPAYTMANHRLITDPRHKVRIINARLRIALAGVLVLFGILLACVGYLQVADYERYSTL